MNRRRLVSSLVAEGLLSMVLLALSLRAASTVRALQQELRTWQAKLHAAHQAQSAVAGFERHEEVLARQERQVAAAIPSHEQEPFDLVKQFTRLAEQAGATNLSVSIKPRVAVFAGSGPEGLAMFPIHMEFDLDFVQLPALLKSLRSLERLTAIQEVRIVRADSSLPRQKITLLISAYSATPSSEAPRGG